MAGDVQKEGIYQRLMIALKSSRRDIFLRTVIDAAISQLAIKDKDKDAFVYELVRSVYVS